MNNILIKLNSVNVIHVSERERMGLIILPHVLFLFFVTVGGRNIDRRSADEDCDLQVILTTVKDVLKEEVQEKCPTATGIPDGEFIVFFKLLRFSLF